jgi:hypothetical protein
MTKNQLLWSFGIASIFNSIGSFLIMPNKADMLKSSFPNDANDIDDSDVQEVQQQPKEWFWKRAWNSIPSVNGTMQEFKKTLKDVIQSASIEFNDIVQQVDMTVSCKAFSKCFGHFSIFVTTPALLTTYIDQKYSLASIITDSVLLDYLINGCISASISSLFLTWGVQLFEDLSGVKFGNFTATEHYIMCTISIAEAVAFKCIQEWEDTPEKQTIIIYSGDPELLNDYLQNG